MKKWNKTKIIILLLIPLLFSSLTTYIVYSSYLSNYHNHFKILEDETYPDYSILVEDEMILNEPSFNKALFLNQFKLESVTYIGRLKCNLIINSSIYDIQLFWAPEEYYLEHSKISIGENEILMDESLSDLENIDINQQISLNFSYNNNNITITTQIRNFIDSKDVLTSKVASVFVSNLEEKKFVFLTSKTFDEIFGDFFENINSQYLVLFEFSEDVISSYLPQKLDEFLYEKRIELDYYFDYNYNETNFIEYIGRSSSLELQLSNFNDNFKEYTWSRIAVFYIICFGISAVVITNMTRGFFNSQKERIDFYYLRGSKKSNLINEFFSLEIKLAFLDLVIGFSLSTIIMAIFQPQLLIFVYNYAMNLLVNCVTTTIYCLIQFIVSVDCLSAIYRRNVDKELFLLNKIIIALKNGLQWIFLCITFAVSLYLFLFSSIEEVEFSSTFFYIFALVIILILLLIISRKTIIWIGERITSLLNHFSQISKYTFKISKRVIRVNSLVIQMLILFSLVDSFFVVGVDTINHYNYINQQNNSIGDIIISYPERNMNLVKSYLTNFTEYSLEIEYVISSMDFKIDETSFISRGVRVFLLNTSTIKQFFKLDIIQNKYSGNYNADQVMVELSENWNMSIINRFYANLANIQKGETTELSLPIKDESPFYFEDWYNITVLDTVDFVPLFSGISQEQPFVILNSEITSNRTEINLKSIYQILWLSSNSSVQILEQFITNINRELNLNIDIFNVDKKILFTDIYWLPSILETLMLSLFTVIIFCLIFFFYIFYFEVIKFQINNFRIFFARGLSLKKGMLNAVLPVFLFTIGYILMGFILGFSLLLIVLTTIQPEYYLKIPISIFPLSFSLFMGQIIFLSFVLLLAGLFSYRKLQQQIPSVERIVYSILKDEGELI